MKKNGAWWSIVGVGLAACLVGLPGSEARGDSPPALTPAQQEKLKKIQAMFAPGGHTSSGGYGLEKVPEFCGATIPMTIDPSTVALEKMNGDSTSIDSTCHAFAGSIAYTCGYEADADPVIKEMIRSNVKRMVCRATNDADQVNNYGVKYALENGTLTLTYNPKNAGNIMDEGQKFLQNNVHGPTGLTIAGALKKRELFTKWKKGTLYGALKNDCGISFDTAIDDKLANHFAEPKNTGYSGLAMCDAGMQSIYNMCASAREFEKYNPAVVAAAVKKNLKTISCVYSDVESIAVRPNGVLELGYKRDAKRQKVDGRDAMYPEDVYMAWLTKNAASWQATPVAATTGAASPDAPAAPPAASAALATSAKPATSAKRATSAKPALRPRPVTH